MRLIRFSGAISLDGYIAGPNGEYDWIVTDPDFDFGALWKQFDTFLIGRRTYDTMRQMGNTKPMKGFQHVVFSRTMRPADCPGATLSDDAVSCVKELRTKPGKDIAVFGGGELFRCLLAARLVDRVEVSLVPVLLGGGIPLLPPPAGRTKLKLRKEQLYQKSGTVCLEFDVLRD
jgi:dihydrofolate reductase